MTDQLTSIITLLEQRKTAIENALTALREIGGATAPTQVTATSTATVETPGRKGKKRTAEQRRRMAEGQRKRYAALRGESEAAVAPAPAPEAATPKRKISAEGIKKIVAATKARWARVRAEAKAAQDMAEAKKAARKKSAPAKAVKKAAPGKKKTAVAADEVPF